MLGSKLLGTERASRLKFDLSNFSVTSRRLEPQSLRVFAELDVCRKANSGKSRLRVCSFPKKRLAEGTRLPDKSKFETQKARLFLAVLCHFAVCPGWHTVIFFEKDVKPVLVGKAHAVTDLRDSQISIG